MKTSCFSLVAATLVAASVPSQGAITGQWDFENDLSATIGQPISELDTETQAGTEFGTTTSFGISNIGGAEGRVMKFPKTVAEFGGYYVPTSASPNGGGFSVNQYTIIMDVLFPADSSGKARSLINTDFAGDAEYTIQASNGVGPGDSSNGQILPDTWHRIAFAVDLSATPSVVDTFIDGVKVGSQASGGLDSVLALFDSFYLFNDDNDETELGYINSLQIRDEKLSDGLIGALGGATAAGILTGPPPNPYIASLSPSPESARIPSRSTVSPRPEIRIVVEDGTSKVVNDSIVLKFDDATVTPVIEDDGDTITITYTHPEVLTPLSIHRVSLSFTDDATPANILGSQWQFAVGPFTVLPENAALPLGSANTRGFTIRTVQGPPYIMESANPTNLPITVIRAIQHLNGTLRDIEGNLVEDESLEGPNADGSYDWDGIINFHTEALEVGNFPVDDFFPGIPGETGHTTQFTTEVLTFLELPAGVHRFGASVNVSRVDVNDDDGYTLFVGQNPSDLFSTIVGSFLNLTGGFAENAQNNNEFNFYAPVAGIYPFRLLYYQGGREGSLEWYSVNSSTGERIPINDPAHPDAIKAFRNSTAPASGTPFIAEVSPRSGTLGNDPAQPLVILIDDDRHQLNADSILLNFDGVDVTPTIAKSGNRTTITYQPNPNRTETTNDVRLVFADNASTPNRLTNEWFFGITVNTGGGSNPVRGQWDFDDGNLAATVGQPLEYFDGAAGKTQTGTKFGTATSFGLPTIGGEDPLVMEVPGSDDRDIGYIMRHGIAPNGGGNKVNQYTLIIDLLLDTQDTGNAAAALLQTDSLVNQNDGDLFWQGNNFGQGIGGYEGTGAFTLGEWHRIAIAVDLSASPGVITKFVDGVKQQDWSPDSLDGRRALQDFAVLFADGDQDERRRLWVNSIQIREGKLTDAQLAYLGGPSPAGIPEELPAITVSGQWDFNDGNLSATIGTPLEFFDGAGGKTESGTLFGTTTSFGLPNINGQEALVMEVPGTDDRDIGYIMRHGIDPNGGGNKVNQYTLIMDILLDTQDTGNAAAALLQTDSLVNQNDGDLFWQGNNFGQGIGGYEGTGIFTLGEWHRVAIAVDLSTTPGVITKFVDGVKQQDWSPDALDGRRALQELAILFADGDQDERRRLWVNSVQIRSGKLSDAQLAYLGGPSAAGIPLFIPSTSVTGQWDFDNGTLAATAGKPLEFFDGPGGKTESGTQFGTTTSLGLPDINGEEANVMEVPGADDRDIGYIIRHGIAPNGGGNRVNQYTLIMDVLLDTEDTGNAAAALLQTDSLVNQNDGDLFWQGNNFGQGIGGYEGTGIFTLGEWHRIAIAVDLSSTPGVITKFVDGVKQQDWSPDALDGRRALQEHAILFADGDQDERRRLWVNSVQIREGKLSDAQLEALGGPSAAGIPIFLDGGPTEPDDEPTLVISRAADEITISWDSEAEGFVLESTTDLAVPDWTTEDGVVNNNVTIPVAGGQRYFRLRK